MQAILDFMRPAILDSLIAEVSVTPKPGLVDCHDSGAHRDMNYQTFIDSSLAITPYLLEMFRVGLTFPSSSCVNDLFLQIRPIGAAAEQAMFAATAGINTHKGMIFSLGTIAAAAGLYYQKYRRFSPVDILLLAGDICAPSMRQDFSSMNQDKPQTHGEALYVRYGCKGIRGEAMAGFPAIRTLSYPYLLAHMTQLKDVNVVYIDTLFVLMANMDDTNVLSRTSPDTLLFMQEQARLFLRQGGAASPEAGALLSAMNQDFIRRRISPGGCADLLAVTIFLWKLEQYR